MALNSFPMQQIELNGLDSMGTIYCTYIKTFNKSYRSQFMNDMYL